MKPTHLIIHVGTNDLSGKLPDNSPVKILQNWGKQQALKSEIKLCISEVITRSDGQEHDKKVQYNKFLVYIIDIGDLDC